MGGDNLTKEKPGVLMYWEAFDAMEKLVDGKKDAAGNPSLCSIWRKPGLSR